MKQIISILKILHSLAVFINNHDFIEYYIFLSDVMPYLGREAPIHFHVPR